MTNEIQWKDGAVCYAYGEQWFVNNIGLHDHCPLIDGYGYGLASLEWIINHSNFQLNEIRTGDFITASELETEQKYNDVVDVFGLFGIKKDSITGFKGLSSGEFRVLGVRGLGFANSNFPSGFKRELTYQQIMTIGKLKRMSDKKKTSNAVSTVNRDIERNQQKTAKDYLAECMEVQTQRGEQYDSTGTGERSFDAAAKAYNALTGGNLKGSDVCLILTCVKAVRQYSNPERLHEDSLLDMVSYSSLWAEELNKEIGS